MLWLRCTRTSETAARASRRALRWGCVSCGHRQDRAHGYGVLGGSGVVAWVAMAIAWVEWHACTPLAGSRYSPARLVAAAAMHGPAVDPPVITYEQ